MLAKKRDRSPPTVTPSSRCRAHSASTVSAYGEDEDLVHGAVERGPPAHMVDRNWVRGDHTGPFCACRRRRNDALSQLTIMHGACLGVVLSVKCRDVGGHRNRLRPNLENPSTSSRAEGAELQGHLRVREARMDGASRKWAAKMRRFHPDPPCIAVGTLYAWATAVKAVETGPYRL